jgi:hypothetical protein
LALHFVSLLGCVTADQLVEIAFLPSGSFVLNEQRQVAFVELPEPLVPSNRFQRVLSAVAGEIQANHSHVVPPASPADTGRSCSAFFRPTPNLVMIGQGMS